MLKIRKKCILFELCLWKKKGDEEKRSTKLKFSTLVFSNLLKVSETFGADITLEHEMEVVLSFLSLSALFSLELFLSRSTVHKVYERLPEKQSRGAQKVQHYFPLVF